MSILLGLWLARPVTAYAPEQSNSEDYISSDITIKDNALQPLLPATGTREHIPEQSLSARSKNGANARKTTEGVYSGRHSTRAEKTISDEQLTQYLADKASPLAPYSKQILASPYWSTIIGICTIEQYGCTRAPGNNYWGIKGQAQCGTSKRGFAQYCTAEEGISAISNLLGLMEQKGKGTIEELNCYYVQPCSSNWLSTVIRTKNELESLQ